MPKSRPQFAPVSPPPTPRLALSIPEFCQAHGISEGFFYKLKKQGDGPREMKVGARTLITFESAAEWRRAREIKHTQAIGSQREQSDQITAEKKDGRERASPGPGCNHSRKRG
jgi:predicted DNA-binding transcriptional regulator AlpA